MVNAQRPLVHPEGFAMLHTFCVAIAVFLPSSIAALADDAKDQEAMRGTWVPTAAELAGQEFPENIRKSITLVIKGDRYTVTVGKQPDQGTVKLNPKAKPKEMDITGTEGPNKDKTYKAIYELDGDTLRVCYDLSGKDRPTEFKTKADTQLFLVTYKREKK